MWGKWSSCQATFEDCDAPREESALKVLTVIMSLDERLGGGAAERSYQLARHLARQGVDSTLLTIAAGSYGERASRLDGAGLISLRCVNARYFVPGWPWRLLREAVERSDIVLLVNHWTVVNALAGRAALSCHRPYVVCPAGGLPIEGRSALIKRIFNAAVGRRLIREASAHIAISPNELGSFATYGVDPDSVCVIPNGVDPDDFRDGDGAAFRARHGLAGAFVALFVGRLHPIKGPDLLVRAFQSVAAERPDAHLVIAGPDGGLLAELRSMATGDLGARVHFVGHISGPERSAAYRAADLVVIPSRREAMSIVALEAGVCGTPVLLTDRCGFSEVERCGGGREVAANVPALRQAILDLAASPEECRAMGRRLKSLVEGRYLWSLMAREHVALFERVLSRKAM